MIDQQTSPLHGAASAGHKLRSFMIGAALLICGCGEQDTVQLSRIGQLMAGRVEALTVDANMKLANGWQAMRGDATQIGLDARVAARLHWDKLLEKSTIDVHCEMGVVTLKGTVTELAQRKRAVDLAQSTAAVEKVVDEMAGPSTDP